MTDDLRQDLLDKIAECETLKGEVEAFRAIANRLTNVAGQANEHAAQVINLLTRAVICLKHYRSRSHMPVDDGDYLQPGWVEKTIVDHTDQLLKDVKDVATRGGLS